MNRGIVMEIGKHHVIVLTPDGQFRKVPGRHSTAVGEEISFTERERLRKPRALYSAGIVAAAIMLLLFVPFLVKQNGIQPPVAAYLTMDINPSVELGVDDAEHVVELRALNKDGAAVTSNLEYKGLPVEQVAEKIMEQVKAGPYLNSGEGDVVITSVIINADIAPAYESELTERVDAAVRKVLAKSDKGPKSNVEVTTLSAPIEVRDEANVKGLSSGKMAVYLLAKSQGREVTLEQLKTHSIHQMVKAWGGLDAIVNDPKDKEPDKEKQKEKQKEQLKELLKEEKKAAPANRALDNDNKDDEKKDEVKKYNDKKDNDKKDNDKNESGKPDDKATMKDDDPDKNSNSRGQFGSRSNDSKSNDDESNDDKQKAEENEEEDTGLRQNEFDEAVKSGNGISQTTFGTQPWKRPDPGVKLRDRGKPGNGQKTEPSDERKSKSNSDNDNGSGSKQKGSSEEKKQESSSGQELVKNDSNGRDVDVLPDKNIGRSGGEDDKKDKQKDDGASRNDHKSHE